MNGSWVNWVCLLNTLSWVFFAVCLLWDGKGCACSTSLRQTDLWMWACAFKGKAKQSSESHFCPLLAFLRLWLCTGICWFLAVCVHPLPSSLQVHEHYKMMWWIEILKKKATCSSIPISSVCEQWLVPFTVWRLWERPVWNHDFKPHQELPLGGSVLDSQASFPDFQRKCSFPHFTLGKSRCSYQKYKNEH